MKSGKREWLWFLLFILAAGALIVGYKVLSLRFGYGFIIALTPLLPGFLILWWMDRFPPMGSRLWVRSILWGLLPVTVIASNTHVIVSVVIAGMVERSGFFDPGSGETFGSLAGSILSAPIVEESLKIFLALWLLCRNHSFTGPWPALLVGSLSALGFGLLENAVQFGGASATASGGGAESFFPARSLFPYLHVFFSLPALLAIGHAVFLPTLSRRLALVVLGWLFSIGLHGLWNWEVLLGHSDFSIASWYLHMVEVAPIVVLAALLLVYLSESRALASSGISIPGIFRRFHGAGVEEIRNAREERFLRFLFRDLPPARWGHYQTEGDANSPVRS